MTEELKIPVDQALNNLKIERYCCKRMLMTHVEVCDTLMKYNTSLPIESNKF